MGSYDFVIAVKIGRNMGRHQKTSRFKAASNPF